MFLKSVALSQHPPDEILEMITNDVTSTCAIVSRETADTILDGFNDGPHQSEDSVGKKLSYFFPGKIVLFDDNVPLGVVHFRIYTEVVEEVFFG